MFYWTIYFYLTNINGTGGVTPALWLPRSNDWARLALRWGVKQGYSFMSESKHHSADYCSREEVNIRGFCCF